MFVEDMLNKVIVVYAIELNIADGFVANSAVTDIPPWERRFTS